MRGSGARAPPGQDRGVWCPPCREHAGQAVLPRAVALSLFGAIEAGIFPLLCGVKSCLEFGSFPACLGYFKGEDSGSKEKHSLFYMVLFLWVFIPLPPVQRPFPGKFGWLQSPFLSEFRSWERTGISTVLVAGVLPAPGEEGAEQMEEFKILCGTKALKKNKRKIKMQTDFSSASSGRENRMQLSSSTKAPVPLMISFKRAA